MPIGSRIAERLEERGRGRGQQMQPLHAECVRFLFERRDQRVADAGTTTLGEDEDGAEQAVGSPAFQTAIADESICIEPEEHAIRLREIGARQVRVVKEPRQSCQFTCFKTCSRHRHHAMLILIASAASVMSSTGTVSVTPTRK